MQCFLEIICKDLLDDLLNYPKWNLVENAKKIRS